MPASSIDAIISNHWGKAHDGAMRVLSASVLELAALAGGGNYDPRRSFSICNLPVASRGTFPADSPRGFTLRRYASGVKVFISWSGEPSRSIARALTGWLRTVKPDPVRVRVLVHYRNGVPTLNMHQLFW
jgi:hypothetical protein